MANRKCWTVKPEVLSDPKWQSHGINTSDPEYTNNWIYTLEKPNVFGPGRTPSTNDAGENETPGRLSTSASPTNTPKRKIGERGSADRISDKPLKSPAPNSLITKFTKVLTPEERLRQLERLKEKVQPTLLSFGPTSSDSDTAIANRNQQIQQKMAEITQELIDNNSKS